MPHLVLGPQLRYLDETQATVWVETDAPCEVEVLGRREHTFRVEGHHYALVPIRELEPGRTYEYEVMLDGERHWPDSGSQFPASAIRTIDPNGTLKLVFGSCRVAVPHEPPYSLTKDEDELGREIDALYALAVRMRERPRDQWPQMLLCLGDQVYVDEDSPRTREFIRARRDVSKAPHEEVADFEEYTRLYRESWGDPTLRWLFSTLGTAMIFDDHDVHDDWNTSEAWVEEVEAQPWWEERIVSALMSYWIYQHLGNLSPERLSDDEVYTRVRESREEAGPVIREHARRTDREREGVWWSYKRDLGRTRLIVMDSRIGRVVDEGKRSICTAEEREWIREESTGDFDHLLIATSDPFLLAHGMHYLEAWSEAVCDGKWGRTAAKLGEKLRRSLDLDHWAAFHVSFESLAELLRDVGSGELGPPPASVVVLSGDVHHAYLAEVGFPPGSNVQSHVYQAVCSPYRNPLDDRERTMIRAAASRPAWAIARAMAKAVGAYSPHLGWRFVDGPYFDNQVATLYLDGRRADMKLEKTKPGEEDEERLETSFERRLA
jgi:PhoD-like phosphatase